MARPYLIAPSMARATIEHRLAIPAGVLAAVDQLAVASLVAHRAFIQTMLVSVMMDHQPAIVTILE